MRSVPVLALAFVLHIANGNSPCFDVDTESCTSMEHNKPDLCQSSRGELECPRHCGKCPLECFSCQDLVQDISQCNKVITCDPNQTCYTMEIFDFDRSHGFLGGCIAKELCVPHRGDASIFGRSSSTVHTQCCDSDKCNGRSTTTTSTTSATTRHSTTASDCLDPVYYFKCRINDCAYIPPECRKDCKQCCKLLF